MGNATRPFVPSHCEACGHRLPGHYLVCPHYVLPADPTGDSGVDNNNFSTPDDHDDLTPLNLAAVPYDYLCPGCVDRSTTPSHHTCGAF